jgi:hypothetical protein
MKRRLFITGFILVVGFLFAQNANKSFDMLFLVLADVSARLDADEQYQVLWENKDNGRFFIATVTGKDQDGKNTYGRNAYIITPLGRNNKYPMFAIRETVSVNTIINTTEECGTVILQNGPEIRGVVMRVTTARFYNENAAARFERIIQGLKRN